MALSNHFSSYSMEDLHNALSVLTDDLVVNFEDACLTTVVTCGPPPVRNYFHDMIASQQYIARMQWLQDVEGLAFNRFGVKLDRLNEFVIAFEVWWSMQQETESDTSEWAKHVRDLAYVRSLAKSKGEDHE